MKFNALAIGSLLGVASTSADAAVMSAAEGNAEIAGGNESFATEPSSNLRGVLETTTKEVQGEEKLHAVQKVLDESMDSLSISQRTDLIETLHSSLEGAVSDF